MKHEMNQIDVAKVPKSCVDFCFEWERCQTLFSRNVPDHTVPVALGITRDQIENLLNDIKEFVAIVLPDSTLEYMKVF